MGLFTSKKRSSSSKRTTTSSTSSSTSQPQMTHQRNTSTSNLSTTSTLLNAPLSYKRGSPPPYSSRPSPPARQSSYEAFLHHARLDRDRSEALRMMQEQQQAWNEAERRRRGNGQHWPNDPWRGGFGPPSTGNGGGRRMGEREVGDWLRWNGFSRR